MAAVTFALTPGRASTATLDYTTTEGIKFYTKDTKVTAEMLGGLIE